MKQKLLGIADRFDRQADSLRRQAKQLREMANDERKQQIFAKKVMHITSKSVH